jgi:hypothetical protein
MNFDSQHVLIGLGLAIIAMILYYMYAGAVEGMAPVTQHSSVDNLIDKLNDEELKQHSVYPNTAAINPSTTDKLTWKNQATGGYINSSFVNGSRGNAPTGAFDAFYNDNTDFIDKSYTQNNGEFMPLDETGGNMAQYNGKGQTKQSAEDLFKIDKLLPQEVNPNWFEVMPEPIKVQNRHLINVTRPVGVNTIGTSHKNPSYDIRLNPPCPKFTVSPWMQSSIEPDLNVKGLN